MFTKRFTLSTSQNMPHVTATITKMRFVGSNSGVYYDNLQFYTKDYLQIFRAGFFISRKHCHGF